MRLAGVGVFPKQGSPWFRAVTSGLVLVVPCGMAFPALCNSSSSSSSSTWCWRPTRKQRSEADLAAPPSPRGPVHQNLLFPLCDRVLVNK